MRKNFSLRIYKTSHNQKITEKVQKGNRKLKSHLYHYISEDMLSSLSKISTGVRNLQEKTHAAQADQSQFLLSPLPT